MKVGDYVRIINTLESYVEIIKIKELNEYDGYLLDERNYQYSTDEIIKSSPSIIDLLETGDIIHYQNEYIDFISPVIVYDDGEIASNLYDSDGYIFLDKEIDENNIKSIVTKEQFESMEYKVGE